MPILSPVSDIAPWTSGRQRFTVEKISWSISTKEWCLAGASNPRPPDNHSDMHPTELLAPANFILMYTQVFTVFTSNLINRLEKKLLSQISLPFCKIISSAFLSAWGRDGPFAALKAFTALLKQSRWAESMYFQVPVGLSVSHFFNDLKISVWQ